MEEKQDQNDAQIKDLQGKIKELEEQLQKGWVNWSKKELEDELARLKSMLGQGDPGLVDRNKELEDELARLRALLQAKEAELERAQNSNSPGSTRSMSPSSTRSASPSRRNTAKLSSREVTPDLLLHQVDP